MENGEAPSCSPQGLKKKKMQRIAEKAEIGGETRGTLRHSTSDPYRQQGPRIAA